MNIYCEIPLADRVHVGKDVIQFIYNRGKAFS